MSLSSFTMEASAALEGVRGVGAGRRTSESRVAIEATLFRRIVAMAPEARGDAVKRAKRLIGKGLLAADTEAIADILLSEGSRTGD
jgi:anti-sigma28 factor (negative regulator of flagellin synthesis)